MRAAFVDVEGVRTRYLHAGSGPAVFLLHGIGFSADCFIRNIDALADRYTVYAVDMLGHGFTDGTDYKGVAPQIAMAWHIAALAEQLGIDRYVLMGSSFGAHVAAHGYLLHPDRVSGLGLIGSGSVFHADEEQKQTLQNSLANGRRAMVGADLASCRRRLENIVFDPACVPPELMWIQVTTYARHDRVTDYEAAINGSVAAMDSPGSRVLPVLEQIACPTLVIVGRNDIRADWQTHLDGAARMPHAQTHVYESCGHFPFLEHVSMFNRQASEFLNSIN